MGGVLCYDKCPAGTKRFGYDCHSVCPGGWDDQGLFCRKSEYGRTAGYAVWDAHKCADHPLAKEAGGCEWWGWMMYPKCKKGYHAFGCCLCRPDKIDCPAENLNWGVDLSCAKKVHIGNPQLGICKAGHEMYGGLCYEKCKKADGVQWHNFGCCLCRPPVPTCKDDDLDPWFDLSCAKRIYIGSPQIGECEDGQEMDAGLCYEKCDAGYRGTGPVCWGKAPGSWVECGMGAAVDDTTCGLQTADQVVSVLQTIGFIASLGTTGAGVNQGIAGAKKASWSAMKAGLKSSFKGGATAALKRGLKAVTKRTSRNALEKARQQAYEAMKRTAKKATDGSIFDLSTDAGKLAQKEFTKTKRSLGDKLKAFAVAVVEVINRAGTAAVENFMMAQKVVDAVAVASADETMTDEDYTREAANYASYADPSGVAGIIGAYTFPQCSTYFKGKVAKYNSTHPEPTRTYPQPPDTSAAAGGQVLEGPEVDFIFTASGSDKCALVVVGAGPAAVLLGVGIKRHHRLLW
eukprot:g7684.t1